MRHLLGRSTFLSLLAVLICAPSLQAAPACDNRDFRGVYGMIARGDIYGVILPAFNPTIGPVIRVSRVVADGAGHVHSFSNANYNGFFLAEEFGGTYEITADCNIRFDLIVPLPFICSYFKSHPACANGEAWVGVPVPFVFNGSIIEGGADILIGIASPIGATVKVHLERQNANTFIVPVCSEQDLSGVFQLDMDGKVINQPPLIAGPFARTGSLIFDGRGTWGGNTFTNYVNSGAASQEKLSGTYTVTRDCTFTMKYSVGSRNYEWLGVLTNGGHGAFIMVSSPNGAVVGGTLLQARGVSSGG